MINKPVFNNIQVLPGVTYKMMSDWAKKTRGLPGFEKEAELVEKQLLIYRINMHLAAVNWWRKR